MHENELHITYRGVRVLENYASIQPADNDARGLEAFMDGVDAVLDMMPQKIILGEAPPTPTEGASFFTKLNRAQSFRVGKSPSEGAI